MALDTCFPASMTNGSGIRRNSMMKEFGMPGIGKVVTLMRLPAINVLASIIDRSVMMASIMMLIINTNGMNIIHCGIIIILNGKSIFLGWKNIIHDGMCMIPNGKRLILCGMFIILNGKRIIHDWMNIIHSGKSIFLGWKNIILNGMCMIPNGKRLILYGMFIIFNGKKIIHDWMNTIHDGMSIILSGKINIQGWMSVRHK